MIPYFYNLKTQLLTTTEKAQVIDVAVKHRDEFISYVSKNGTTDGNQLWRGDDLYNLPCVSKLVSSCALVCVPVIIRHAPNSVVIKHVDDPNKRNTVLSIPLSPTVGYAPTGFFKKMEDTVPASISRFENMDACLLNTQEIHGLINRSSEDRLNLQLMFNDSFYTVVQLIVSGQLFLD